MRKDELDYETGSNTDQSRLLAIEKVRKVIIGNQDLYAYNESEWREQQDVLDFYKAMIEFINKSEYINEIYLCIQTMVTVAVTSGPKAISTLCEGTNEIAMKRFIIPLSEEKRKRNG